MWKEDIRYYDRLDSTNLEACRQAREQAPEGRVIVAAEQTAGRGRRGRSWSSPKGNLYFSIVLRPRLALEKTPQLTLLMGLAVAEAVGIPEAKIKWPNDIVIEGKKVSGILAEMAPVEQGASPFCIIGVGVNIHTDELEEELQSTAIGLLEARSVQADCALSSDGKLEVTTQPDEENARHLLIDILDVFRGYYEEYCESDGFAVFAERYNARCVNCNQEVFIHGPAGDYRGVALGVNEKGELLVRREDGNVVCVTAGEVSVRGIYGYV